MFLSRSKIYGCISAAFMLVFFAASTLCADEVKREEDGLYRSKKAIDVMGEPLLTKRDVDRKEKKEAFGKAFRQSYEDNATPEANGVPW